jgi:hypothetical protein
MILMYLGAKQVTSAAKGVMLQAIDVPKVAKAKEAEAKRHQRELWMCSLRRGFH